MIAFLPEYVSPQAESGERLYLAEGTAFAKTMSLV